MSDDTETTVKLSSILSGLSYALDLTEGHPRGHSSRSCLIGMRIAGALALSADDRSHLFYALLLKDAGCSSNSARVFQLFGGDDQAAKRGVWLRDWRKPREQIAYVLDYAEPQGTLFQILERVPVFGELAFDASAHHERLDGRGYYRNLTADQLSTSARILCAADQLDALSAERPYRATLPTERVVEIMRGERGTGLWPEAVDAAERILKSGNRGIG